MRRRLFLLTVSSDYGRIVKTRALVCLVRLLPAFKKKRPKSQRQTAHFDLLDLFQISAFAKCIFKSRRYKYIHTRNSVAAGGGRSIIQQGISYDDDDALDNPVEERTRAGSDLTWIHYWSPDNSLWYHDRSVKRSHLEQLDEVRVYWLVLSIITRHYISDQSSIYSTYSSLRNAFSTMVQNPVNRTSSGGPWCYS